MEGCTVRATFFRPPAPSPSSSGPSTSDVPAASPEDGVDRWRDEDDDLAVVCEIVDIGRYALLRELEAGGSIAMVAEAHAVDPQDVIDALVEDQRDDLDERIAYHEVTKEQAAAIRRTIATRAVEFVYGADAAVEPAPSAPGQLRP
jgi:hypothetical protein